jgi:hypothetical protein
MAAASDSLNRMTVPLQDGTDQALLMPKLKYRFRVTLQNFGVNTPVTELTKQVIDFARPSVTFEEIPIDIYNSKIYLAGKHAWETTTLNVRDDASNTVSALVGQQLQKQLDFYEQSSAAAGIDYKFTLSCEILDGSNGANQTEPIETWTLVGCYLTGANYNDLNYGSSEAVTISLSIRFDNALLSQGTAEGPGLSYGAAIGRGVAGGLITGSGSGTN